MEEEEMGSSGSDEEGNGGISTIPLPPTTGQSTYDVLRGLGIVGGSGQMGDDDQLQSLRSRSGTITHGQVIFSVSWAINNYQCKMFISLNDCNMSFDLGNLN